MVVGKGNRGLGVVGLIWMMNQTLNKTAVSKQNLHLVENIYMINRQMKYCWIQLLRNYPTKRGIDIIFITTKST